MIEGTRQFKGGERKKEAPEAGEPSSTTPQEPQAEAIPHSDAMNLERREWFSSLLPALGDGLVKILRVSNNLQQELHTALKEKTDSFALSPPPEQGEPDEKQKPSQ